LILWSGGILVTISPIRDLKIMIELIKYGNTNTYLLKGTKGNLLIDTDYAGTLQGFFRAIKDVNVSLQDITYILATHYHPDHIGLVSELMDLGVNLIVVDTQTDSIHYSDEIFARLPALKYKPIDEGKAKILGISESRQFLKELGIEGEIVSTPSHSKDSISIALDEGVCIVGDLEPIEYLEAYDDNEALAMDWNAILNFKPKRVCFAHANEKHF
jgi:glyoxylase-like metal-dependent hydrolase (beta-lactamase superfamily II)